MLGKQGGNKTKNKQTKLNKTKQNKQKKKTLRHAHIIMTIRTSDAYTPILNGSIASLFPGSNKDSGYTSG